MREKERENTLLLPSLLVPVLHLALLLVFLRSLVLPVDRWGFGGAPLHPLALGRNQKDRAGLLLQPKPLSAKRQPEHLLPGVMGPLWVGKGACVSQDGEKQVGIQPPLE